MENIKVLFDDVTTNKPVSSYLFFFSSSDSVESSANPSELVVKDNPEPTDPFS